MIQVLTDLFIVGFTVLVITTHFQLACAQKGVTVLVEQTPPASSLIHQEHLPQKDRLHLFHVLKEHSNR